MSVMRVINFLFISNRTYQRTFLRLGVNTSKIKIRKVLKNSMLLCDGSDRSEEDSRANESTVVILVGNRPYRLTYVSELTSKYSHQRNE